ncbi:MAG: hypothetical protein PUP92_30980 [Rhizonema sp. PD38]|nr:hypothetical protein [Rhizonema sp. PD38]
MILLSVGNDSQVILKAVETDPAWRLPLGEDSLTKIANAFTLITKRSLNPLNAI